MRVNIFSRKISAWKSIDRTATNRYETTLGDFLNAGTTPVQTILRLRQLYNEATRLYDTDPDASNQLFEKYKREKEQLHLASIGGNFANGGKSEELLEASNCICLDIDKCKPYKAALYAARGEEVPNAHITDWEALKWRLSKIPYIAYIGLSVSGNGIYCIIPIADYHHHAEAWDALSYLFKKYFKIEIDRQTRDLARPRFASYDPQPYVNAQAQVFEGVLRPQRTTATPTRNYAHHHRPATDTEVAVLKCVEEIERRCLDITSDYGEWVDIAAALYNGLGDVGKEYYLRLSRFHDRFSERETEYKWQKNKNRPSVGIGTFFKICSDNGIRYTSAPTSRPAPTPPPPPSAAPSATVEATPPKIVYRPVLPDPCSIIDTLTAQEFDEFLSPQAVAAWQAQHPAAPF